MDIGRDVLGIGHPQAVAQLAARLDAKTQAPAAADPQQTGLDRLERELAKPDDD